jgi:hypothetical protein
MAPPSRAVPGYQCRWGPAPTAGGRLMTATGLVFGFVLCPAWLRMAHADAVAADHAAGLDGVKSSHQPVRLLPMDSMPEFFKWIA